MDKRFFAALMISFLLIWPSQSTSCQVIINELLGSNGSVNLSEGTKQFSDWVELYNSSDQEIDLAGYLLSDNQDDPAKWIFPPHSYIPANGFLIVYADNLDSGLHTNFALSKDGEEILLHDDSGNLQDILEFPEQKSDISYGRNPDNIGQWLFFGDPSPGTENPETGVIRPISVETPGLIPEAGFYNSTVIAQTVSNPPNWISIRYTTDGSTPTSLSPLLSEDIEISVTTTLKIRAFENGKLPGKVTTHTYFINEKTTLPVFSLAMNPDYLWDEEVGIYVDGSKFNGNRSSRNSCQPDWERPMHIEFFEANGDLIFSKDAGIQVKGRMNCEFPKKPLGVYFRSKYGENKINYPFFREKPVNQFSSFILRPGGADGMGDCYNGTMIRDGLLGNMLAGQMDIDYEGFRPAVLFINGEYWGVHNIRERNKSDYLAANHGVDPDNLDLLENPANGGIIEGDDLKYMELLNFARSGEVRKDSTLTALSQLIDIQEFLNYQIAEIFVNNEDWAHNNVLCWRPRTADGVFRWVFFDIEGGFGLYGEDDYENNLFSYKECNFLKHKFLFDRLLTNTRFKSDFIQGFAAHLNSTFLPERVINMIHAMSSEIEAEMEKDVARWFGHTTNGGSGCSPINSMDQWRYHIAILENFAKLRPDIIRQQLKDKFGLEKSIQLDFESEDGSIMVNGVENAKSGEYFAGIPIRLTAVPDIGFEFIGWEEIEGDSQLEFVATEDMQITAIFAPNGESILPLSIRENLILTQKNSPYLATSDIIVESTGVLKISPGVEIRMPESASIYVYGVLQSSGTQSDPIMITSHHGSGKRWGSLVFDKAQPGSIIQNTIIKNASSSRLDPVLFKANLNIIETFVPIVGLTIEDADFNPVYILRARADLRNSTLFSHGVGDYINVAESAHVHIENCTFRGNNAPDTDAIDLDAVSSGQILGNRFKNFRGSNSDGLDVGYSPGINVQQNIFSNISDKGISVGMGTYATVKQNIFLNCTDGIGVKDQNSAVFADRNTFFGNVIGIHCFEKEPGRGGGTATVQNSLFGSQNQVAGEQDAFSQIDYSYCWDTEVSLQGENNRSGDPGWVAPASGNFKLSSESNCRDAGDPDSELDPDGTRADIGAYYYHSDQYEKLFLNELILTENETIVEIYNQGNANVQLSDLYIGTNSLYNEIVNLGILSPGQSTVSSGDHVAIALPGNYLNSISINESLMLYQSVDQEFIPLSGLPISSYLNNYSVGIFPEGSHIIRHFSIPTPGAQNQADLSGQGQIFINELLADNGSSETDPLNNYKDWFELYNAGPVDYDLGGLYLTDNLKNPTKHQLPDSIKLDLNLGSRQFKLFWADEQEEFGFDHLSFKLDADKEELGIFTVMGPDTLMIDSLQFSNQLTNKSLGRYPDGSSNLIGFTNLTPGKSNVFLRVEDSLNSLSARLFPNPFNEVLYLQLTGIKDQSAMLQIIDLKGRIVHEMNLPNPDSMVHTINLAHLPSGIYLSRIITSKSISSARIIKQ